MKSMLPTLPSSRMPVLPPPLDVMLPPKLIVPVVWLLISTTSPALDLNRLASMSTAPVPPMIRTVSPPGSLRLPILPVTIENEPVLPLISMPSPAVLLMFAFVPACA